MAPGAPPVAFAQAKGEHLVVGGKRFRFVGSNAYYLPFSERHTIDSALESMACVFGPSIVRTWAFGEGPRGGLQPEPGKYRERIFAQLDYTIARAASLGLRVVLPLVNNWRDYGGIPQQLEWCGGSTNSDFFRRDECKALFKNHVRALLSRVNSVSGVPYKDDPAIFAFELTNEARSDLLTPLHPWIDEMIAFIKQLDKNHLVTTGLEGWRRDPTRPFDWRFNGSHGSDFHLDHQSADFAVLHLWMDQWELSRDQALDWVRDHALDSRALGRPVVLEEVGLKRDPSGGTATRDAYLRDVLRIAFDHGTSGVLVWMTTFGGYPDYDGYGILPTDTSTLELLQRMAREIQ
jgi:mannan endo-1,4-beta-mannosidase